MMDAAEPISEAINASTQTFKLLKETGNGFWNVRAPFYAGPLDIGTHMSICRLNNGKFLVIDTIPLNPELKSEIDTLTSNGTMIETVIASHPYHTTYFKPFHDTYPQPDYYGTERHISMIKSIPWKGDVTDLSVQQKWESEGVFMRIVAGADFIDSGHFSSIFVFHKAGRTIHVDDTLFYLDEESGCLLPCLFQCLGGAKPRSIMLHTTVFDNTPNSGLYCTETAASQFKNFLQSVVDDWDFDSICTAHKGKRVGGAKQALVECIEANNKGFDAYSRKYKGK